MENNISHIVVILFSYSDVREHSLDISVVSLVEVEPISIEHSIWETYSDFKISSFSV